MGGSRVFFSFPLTSSCQLSVAQNPQCWFIALIPRWNVSANVLLGFPPPAQPLRRPQGCKGQQGRLSLRLVSLGDASSMNLRL